ncbi:MAG: hypothetical protein HOH58_11585 [Opitutaceae bacterium]|nr:hypothetical protein [Opitutaceae bacterium]
MRNKIGRVLIGIIFLHVAGIFELTAVEEKPNGERGSDDWIASEYGSGRTAKDMQTAFASKGFAWLSGSPADNEKLSIGKNAQLFGFVALRYQSGRAANRGALGRAFHGIATDAQRALLEKAVMEEIPRLAAWWTVREQMLRLLEIHLYEGGEIDTAGLEELGARFGEIGGQVALTEARAFAAMEDLLSDTQRQTLAQWRQDPEQAIGPGNDHRIRSEALDRNELKQLEDLFAKNFSWITGEPADSRIIPLGQPAQFFGFVSIRQKSGHAANRGQIAKSFLAMLTHHQKTILRTAVSDSEGSIADFLRVRDAILNQLQLLRDDAESFDAEAYAKLSRELGILEINVAVVEARAYRRIRENMTPRQIARMMDLRGEYIMDPSQIEMLDAEKRGEALYILCTGCHGVVGQRESLQLGPSLVDIVGRPIAAVDGYAYSNALKNLASSGQVWTPEQLNLFLVAPKQMAPGTKMEFTGLLQAEDRAALIGYLDKL